MTRRWVYEQHQLWWHGGEGSSPNWLSRVLARFPEQAEGALIKLSWLERPRQRTLAEPVVDDGKSVLTAGVDVGGGESETVVYICELARERKRIIAMQAWCGDDTRGQVVNLLNQYRQRLNLVRVDCIGVGHGFAQHLEDCRFPIERVNVGMACESKPHQGVNDPLRRFVNLKAKYYQGLADAFEKDQVDGLIDEQTIGQLAGILYEIDPQGRLKIESKEQARARGCLSPDRAEALMLALSRPYLKYEYIPAPRVDPFTKRSSESWTYPDDSDDLDYPGSVMSVRRRNRFSVLVGPLRWPKNGGVW